MATKNPMPDMEQITISGHPCSIMIDSREANMWYTCRCSGEGIACDHVKSIIDNRLDVAVYNEFMVNEQLRIINLPLLYNPTLMHPVVLQGRGSYSEVAHAGFNRRPTLAAQEEFANGTHLTTLVEGEGGATIISALHDAFSAFHVERHVQQGMKYQCLRPGHGMKQNNRMLKALKDRATAGEEMLRIALTGGCTGCEDSVAKTGGLSAEEAFGDLIPETDVTTWGNPPRGPISQAKRNAALTAAGRKYRSDALAGLPKEFKPGETITYAMPGAEKEMYQVDSSGTLRPLQELLEKKQDALESITKMNVYGELIRKHLKDGPVGGTLVAADYDDDDVPF